MRIDDWLASSTKKLKNRDIPSARLDALILLEDALGKDRGYLLAHPDLEIDKPILHTLEKQLTRRGAHEPLAYIRGRSEFYGREFKVTHATLQPRAETETMIELFKNILEHNSGFARVGPLQGKKDVVIADIGTGSGCLAVTAKLEFPDAKVFATDINTDALAVAKENAQKLDADVGFYKGNLLEPLFALSPEKALWASEFTTESASPIGSVSTTGICSSDCTVLRPLGRVPSALFALLCNLPYVPTEHTINQAAMQEPSVAIFGGADGLDLYRELFAQIDSQVQKPNYIFTESLPFQHQSLGTIAEASSYKLLTAADFIQVFERA